jgi:hypothetical protein
VSNILRHRELRGDSDSPGEVDVNAGRWEDVLERTSAEPSKGRGEKGEGGEKGALAAVAVSAPAASPA